MDLKEKLADVLARGLGGARIVRFKPVGPRWIVYVVSPAFDGLERVEKHRRLREVLHGPDSPLTVEERRSLGFVRPFTPKELRALVRANRARKRNRKPTEPA